MQQAGKDQAMGRMATKLARGDVRYTGIFCDDYIFYLKNNHVRN